MVKLSLASLLLLTGCATCQPEIRVEKAPEPPTIQRPDLPVLSIHSNMDAGTVIQLHRETIKRLQAWGLELEAALDAYRRK